MIDWLADQYVASGVRSFVFLHNPTFCRWIDALQLLSASIAAAWAARISYSLSLGRRAAETRRARACRGEAAGTAATALEDARTGLVDSRAVRRLRPAAPLVVRGALPWIGTVGLLRPRVLLADAALRLLDARELRAALAHELTHVARRDNLRRAAAEVACFVAPVALWWWYALHLVVSSPLQFVSVLCLGLSSGILLRTLLVPLLVYAQERRADEWAAGAVGDRLVVAAALVKIGAALGRGRPRRLDPLQASFAPYRHCVAGRVRRLLDGDGRGFAALDRTFRRALRLGTAAAAVVLGLAAHRAQTSQLDSRLRVSLCSSPLLVRIQSAPDAELARVSAEGVERLRFEVP